MPDFEQCEWVTSSPYVLRWSLFADVSGYTPPSKDIGDKGSSGATGVSLIPYTPPGGSDDGLNPGPRGSNQTSPDADVHRHPIAVPGTPDMERVSSGLKFLPSHVGLFSLTCFLSFTLFVH